MANYNCEACESIRQTDPNLIVNGIGDTEVASLKNDTGLSASSGHNDCTDLNNLNDCLIGNQEHELDGYEVCDWKTFMKRLIPNLWTTLKAIISAICGLWTNIHSLWSNINSLNTRTSDMCKLLDQIASPSLLPYGRLPLATTSSAIARRCGTATSHVVARPNDGTLNPYTKDGQNIGIAYASMIVTGCTSGRREMLEWIAPSHYYYKLVSGAQSGDILWKISKTDAQNIIGISDYLWNIFVQSSWTWHESALTPSRQVAWMKITVGENGLGANELGLIFMGCTAPNDAISADNEIASFNNASAKMYRHVIS